MPRFEHTIEIDAPIDTVFDFGMDPTNWQRVMPSLREVENVREIDDGLEMETTYQMLGLSFDGEMVFTVVEPNEHTVTSFESSGMTGELHYHYVETDAGTRVVQKADYEFGDSVLQRILEPVAKRYNKRQFRNALETSKELIEAELKVQA